ncbi:hypothetical protein FACS189431_7120 [Alphaproteobacteria bacterium]|nr:hypothetical protein FACS189431_7120 [Alphaproteobacteria bacterium]
MTKLNQLYISGMRVFNTDDLSVLWGQDKRTDTVQSVKKYTKDGKVFRLRRGLYALDAESATEGEVANKALAPSYVTGQTVLAKHGSTFQVTGTVHSAALETKKITVVDTIFQYHTLRPDIFFNSDGVEKIDGVNIATLERAIVDLVYYSRGKYQFEDVEKVNWSKMKKLAKNYNKTTEKRIKEMEAKWR